MRVKGISTRNQLREQHTHKQSEIGGDTINLRSNIIRIPRPGLPTDAIEGKKLKGTI